MSWESGYSYDAHVGFILVQYFLSRCFCLLWASDEWCLALQGFAIVTLCIFKDLVNSSIGSVGLGGSLLLSVVSFCWKIFCCLALPCTVCPELMLMFCKILLKFF